MCSAWNFGTKYKIKSEESFISELYKHNVVLQSEILTDIVRSWFEEGVWEAFYQNTFYQNSSEGVTSLKVLHNI